MFETKRDFCANYEYHAKGKLIYFTLSLDEIWLSALKWNNQKVKLQVQYNHQDNEHILVCNTMLSSWFSPWFSSWAFSAFSNDDSNASFLHAQPLIWGDLQ